MNRLKTLAEKAMHFVTEQVKCFAMERPSESDPDVPRYNSVATYLAGDDEQAMAAYLAATEGLKTNPAGVADYDYDCEDYEGKQTDMAEAVAELMRISALPETPADMRDMLCKTAEDIAAFYGAEALVR